MKHKHLNPMSHPMPLLHLMTSTRVLLHPEFVKGPALYARRHKVDLVGDVYPATSFKKDDDTKETVSQVKANLHLVQYNAIRIYTEREGEGDWITGIEVNPALLLHDDEDYPLTESDLVLVLSMLMAKVAPLLANSLDARHIVPGLVDDDTHVAYWSKIESEVLIPDVDLLCLHGVRHPDTGPAEGATKKRLVLGDRADTVIHIEKAKWVSAGPGGAHEVHGVRVRLKLSGNALVAGFAQSGKTSLMGGIRRLVKFRASEVARVHQETMSWLEGFYLPVPPEWAAAHKANRGRSATHAKTMALLSLVTPIPIEELLAMDEDLRHPLCSTRKRLKKDIGDEVPRLKHVPVATLFRPEVNAAQATGATPQVDVRIDPQVAAAYGSDESQDHR